VLCGLAVYALELIVGRGYTIKALDESYWDTFAGLVEAEH
jgi:hypothetical protein